jgi:hypothetical protein
LLISSFRIHSQNLRSLSADTTSQLDVLGHDRHSLGVDGAKIGVLEQTDQVSLGCFLQSKNCRTLETKIGLEILSNLTNQSLEGKLADQELSGLLVSSDFSKGNSSWAVSVGFLDSSSGRSGFSGSFGGQLFSWSLSSGGLAGSLLCSRHSLSFFFLFCVLDRTEKAPDLEESSVHLWPENVASCGGGSCSVS